MDRTMPGTAWTWPWAPPDYGHRRPASPHAPARPRHPPLLPHLPTPTRRRQSNRTAAALTRQALADAPTTPCAAGTPSSAPPPPNRPVRRRGVTVVHLLCHRSVNASPPSPPCQTDTSPRHLTTAAARVPYKSATPTPLVHRTASPTPLLALHRKP